MESDDSALRRECAAFTRYLTRKAPDTYVIERYLSMHGAVHREAPEILPIDEALVSAASSGPFGARAADAYARFFRPRGLLRRKLILVFAILESSRGFHKDFTSGGPGSGLSAVAGIATELSCTAIALAAGILRFAPRHLLGGGRARRPNQ